MHEDVPIVNRGRLDPTTGINPNPNGKTFRVFRICNNFKRIRKAHKVYLKSLKFLLRINKPI